MATSFIKASKGQEGSTMGITLSFNLIKWHQSPWLFSTRQVEITGPLGEGNAPEGGDKGGRLRVYLRQPVRLNYGSSSEHSLPQARLYL